MGDSERTQLMPDWERFYLYGVEMYLIHKYQPELVDEMKFTFARARQRRESYIKKDENIFSSKEALLNQIVQDLDSAPLKRKREDHHSRIERPGISEGYQQEFREL